MKLDLDMAALIDDGALAQRVAGALADHACIWRPVRDTTALRGLIDSDDPTPNVFITDGHDPELLELLATRPTVWLVGPQTRVPAASVTLDPSSLTEARLVAAIVDAVNLARMGRLLDGPEGQWTAIAHRDDANAGFDIQFQPQWSVDGRDVTAAEALLRWHGLEVAALRPEAFIAASEAQGRTAMLGDWMIERACEHAGAWLDHWPDAMVLALNLTPGQLAAPAFTEMVMQALTGPGLDPTLIEFELNARELPMLVNQRAELLRQLGDLGFGFTIDRVGATLFEPALLRGLPLRTLKLDRTLVQRLDHDPSALQLVKQLGQLALQLGLGYTAVGVETEHQRELLEDAGCDALQGFLLADAMTADEFNALLLAQRERRRGQR